MCMTCGCGDLNDAHGDQRNITMNDLDRSAQAAGISRDEVCQNLEDSLQQMESSNQGYMSRGQNSPEMRG